MADFNIEDFPTNKTAKEMLHMVSEDFYEKSYVGKWLFQVMGIEWHDIKDRLDELPDQFFIETATWGLKWHEIKWGLPVREELTYEQRRQNLIARRDFSKPMTPYAMEEYIMQTIGIEAHVFDCDDDGGYSEEIDHPNYFLVYIYGGGDIDTDSVRETVAAVKQSHTDFDLFIFRSLETEVYSPVVFCDDDVFEICG